MDNTAITEIIQSGNIDTMLDDVSKKTSKPVTILPDGYEIVSLEGHNTNASHYRLNYTTNCITDFVDYCNKFMKKGLSLCFVNQGSMAAESIIDLGTPEEPLHKIHKASLALKKTSAYKELLGIVNKALTQKQVADYLEDWEGDLVIFSSNGEVIESKKAAKRFMDLTIESAKKLNSVVGDFSSSMSNLERIEAKEQETIPSRIEVVITPFHGLGIRTFVLRVSILTNDVRAPQIVLRLVKEEEGLEEMAQDFSTLLMESIDNSQVYIGSV